MHLRVRYLIWLPCFCSVSGIMFLFVYSGSCEIAILFCQKVSFNFRHSIDCHTYSSTVCLIVESIADCVSKYIASPFLHGHLLHDRPLQTVRSWAYLLTFTKQIKKWSFLCLVSNSIGSGARSPIPRRSPCIAHASDPSYRFCFPTSWYGSRAGSPRLVTQQLLERR